MEWISVIRRLPEDTGPVLIAVAGRYVALADWNVEERRFELTTREDAAIIRIEDITHWMPLPEPPPIRNEAMLAALERSAERLKDMPVSGSTEETLKMIRRARAGEMWGYEPTGEDVE